MKAELGETLLSPPCSGAAVGVCCHAAKCHPDGRIAQRHTDGNQHRYAVSKRYCVTRANVDGHGDIDARLERHADADHAFGKHYRGNTFGWLPNASGGTKDAGH